MRIVSGLVAGDAHRSVAPELVDASQPKLYALIGKKAVEWILPLSVDFSIQNLLPDAVSR